MIVAGFDVGFAKTGMAIVEVCPASIRIVRAEVITTEKREGPASADNLRRAQEAHRAALGALLDARVDLVAFEAFSFPRHASVAAKMAMAFSAIGCAASQLGIPCVESRPQSVKEKFCGNRKASKDEMILEARRRFRGFEWPKRKGDWEHIADALAVALVCREDYDERAVA